MGGIARSLGTRALEVGGVDDHVHLLLSPPPGFPIARTMQQIKAGSSRWLKERDRFYRRFAWQEGYGAFTVGVSQVDATVAYIRSQEEHHRRRSFEEEYRDFLLKHGFEFDPDRALG